jgi:gamma-glutamyltranspeptidase/glutathione hydrolase
LTRKPSLENWPAQWRYRPDATAFTAREAMVASTDRYASEVGADVLRAGGNAVDAAVAVSFALAVVNPEAGNIGGGGFLVLSTAGGEEIAVDFRSTAPRAATRDMFLDETGDVGERGVIGHLAVGVPGSVLGMWAAHTRFGTLPWKDLIEPSVVLARGFVVRQHFLRSFTRDVMDGLRRFPESSRIFLPADAPPLVGGTFVQPDLAATLERIREHGPDGFYEGRTAELFVAEMERGGGLITREDLSSYQVVWREPVRFRYRGHTVVTMPPPSSGGITMAESAHALETLDLGALPWHGPEHVHYLAEAWRRAYSDRNHYIADPDFEAMPLATLLSPEYGVWRAGDVSGDAASPSARVKPGVEAFGKQTTHYSVVDAEGNAVAVTTTINSWYGCKVTVAGAGFLLNNDMDDFTSKPGVANQFGLVQGEANAVAPGKRMLSAMTPTIVLDQKDRLMLVLGSPGGATIITTVFQIISNLLDHRLTLAQAVLAPRVHHQHLPDQISYEPGGLTADVISALQNKGHALKEGDELSGDVQAILRLADGSLAGQSDPRRGGVPAGY